MLTSLGCPQSGVRHSTWSSYPTYPCVYPAIVVFRRVGPFPTGSALCSVHGYTSRTHEGEQRKAAERNHEKGKRFGDRSECSLPDPVLDLMNTTRNVISLARNPPSPWFPPSLSLSLSPLHPACRARRALFRKVKQKLLRLEGGNTYTSFFFLISSVLFPFSPHSIISS